jgi:hypothetical protein
MTVKVFMRFLTMMMRIQTGMSVTIELRLITKRRVVRVGHLVKRPVVVVMTMLVHRGCGPIMEVKPHAQPRIQLRVISQF